ncbi:Glucose-Methanol-Choline (GMC) oxidoreductase [uncultured virus]|nr:Glucose-Methanol-Choline (GMC) oxidoreductase [uncultured virus]
MDDDSTSISDVSYQETNYSSYITGALIIISILIIIAIIFLSYRVHVPIPLDTETADIVIIGGGTSACIAAYRLSQRFPRKSIIILERGRDRRNDPIVYNIANAAIAGYAEPYSEVLPTNLPNVGVSVAKMNGGGSSHNFALVVRGSPDFYNDKWREQLHLSYDDLVNQYFPLIEAYYPITSNDSTEDSHVRFTSGKVHMTQLPVSISIGPRILPIIGAGFNQGFQVWGQALEILNNHGPLRASDSFSDAVVQAITTTKNVPIVPDYNTEVVNCTCTTSQLFVDNIIGIRQSTDVAYLPRDVIIFDVEGHGRHNNLQFVPYANVTRVTSGHIEWDNNGTPTITRINSGGQVIMAAGAIYTPFLLELSEFPNENIGKELTTHYGCIMIIAVQPTSHANFVFSSGPLAFVSRNESEKSRDWQFIVAGSINESLLEGIVYPLRSKLFTFTLWNLKPRTRGTVSVNKKTMTPDVKLNLFEDGSFTDPESDLSSLIDGMRWMYQLTQQLNVTYPTLIPVFPPLSVLQDNNPVILEEYIRKGLSLTDHYCSTSKLGTVVNPDNFKLIGSDNIYVVDASVFPQISDGNTNYPVMTMAEIAAQRIGDDISVML